MRRFVAAAVIVCALPLAAVRLGTSPKEDVRVGLAPAIADSTFAKLVAKLSEPGGYFDSDNLVSNEASYLHVLGAMRRLGTRGGAYIGVGPDQNYSYIAQVRPRVAYLIDIRRDNMLQHLLFKALFELSRNRLEYLALLLGKPLPHDVAAWTGRPIDEVVAYLDSARSDRALFDEAREAVRLRATGFGIPLDQADLAKIASNHEEFFNWGLDLRFTSRGRPPRPYYPTYRQLLLEKDLDGNRRNYLVEEADFQYVREMQSRNLLIPVVGNLAGEHALRAIAKDADARGEPVSVLYASNVEFYLAREGSFDRFARNVADLPRARNGVLIRSYFGGYYGGAHPDAIPGYFSTQLLQTLDSFVKEFRDGGYQSYFDVVSRNLVPLR